MNSYELCWIRLIQVNSSALAHLSSIGCNELNFRVLKELTCSSSLPSLSSIPFFTNTCKWFEYLQVKWNICSVHNTYLFTCSVWYMYVSALVMLGPKFTQFSTTIWLLRLLLLLLLLSLLLLMLLFLLLWKLIEHSSAHGSVRLMNSFFLACSVC